MVKTLFWWDPWTPFGPLNKHFGSSGASAIGIPLSSLVSDMLSHEGWNLPPARSDLQLQLFSFLTSINYSGTSDSPRWSIGGKLVTTFSSRDVWNAIRPYRPKVTWAPLIWHKGLIPKHATTVWLFALNRNPTLDMLASWGLDVEILCLLCGAHEESRDHLFF